MSGKFSFKKVIIFAGSYVATVIGSGFATGQEIMQFFSFFGIAGLITCFIAWFLFAILGAEALYRGSQTRPKDVMKIYTLYTGKYIGIFLDWFVPAFLFAVLVIMISGAGATLSEYYGLHPYVGRVAMAVLAFASVSFGLDRLSGILGSIGPVIIVFTIFVGTVSLINNYGSINEAMEFVRHAQVAKPAPNAVVSGVLYASYNIIMVVGFLAGLGATTKNKKETIYGGILGATALMVAAGVMYLAILAQAPELFGKKIPTLVLADQISPWIGKAFSVVLMLGIFSTAAPLLWQCANRFSEDGTKKFRLLSLVFAIGGLIGGFLPFDKLVGTVYPYTGYLGIIIMILIAVKVYRLKQAGKTGEEEMKAIEGRD